MIPWLWVVTEQEQEAEEYCWDWERWSACGVARKVYLPKKEAIVEPPWEPLKTKPRFPGFDRGELPLHFLVEEAQRSLKNGEFAKSKKKSY